MQWSRVCIRVCMCSCVCLCFEGMVIISSQPLPTHLFICIKSADVKISSCSLTESFLWIVPAKTKVTVNASLVQVQTVP